jgi:hypothetical protein
MYAFAFERPAPSFPEREYLMETWEDAEQFCLEEWGVPLDGTRQMKLRTARPKRLLPTPFSAFAWIRYPDEVWPVAFFGQP